MSRTHLKSVRLYLSPLFVFSTVHANSKCCRLLWVENILFSPISPFHTAFQLERISISPKHCHMSPLLSSPSFLKYRFKRSITDIYSYSLPIEASIYWIYTVNIYIYIYIYIILLLMCVKLNAVVLMLALLFRIQEVFDSNFRQEPIKF